MNNFFIELGDHHLQKMLKKYLVKDFSELCSHALRSEPQMPAAPAGDHGFQVSQMPLERLPTLGAALRRECVPGWSTLRGRSWRSVSPLIPKAV